MTEFDSRIDNLRQHIQETNLQYFGIEETEKIIIAKKKKPIDENKVNLPCQKLNDLEYKNRMVKKRTLKGKDIELTNDIMELEQMFGAKTNLLDRPWAKLEPKLKLDRIKNYIDKQEEWSEEERERSWLLLERATLFNCLNKKVDVDYCVEENEIKNIKRLVIKINDDGIRDFSISIEKDKTKGPPKKSNLLKK